MADGNNQNNSTSSPSPARRTSFTSQALADLFGNNRPRPSFGGEQNTAQNNGTSSYPNSLSAAAQASRRRMSLTALGINGGTASSNQQVSPSNGYNRSESVSSQASTSVIDESAVEDGEPLSQSSPTTPFARRMSFGARALRDVRNSTGGPGQTDNGYNWADSFRSRAERSSSIVSTGGSPNLNHTRAKSVATMQPPPVQPAAPKPMVPDHMQERILKGDFYMD